MVGGCKELPSWLSTGFVLLTAACEDPCLNATWCVHIQLYGVSFLLLENRMIVYGTENLG